MSDVTPQNNDETAFVLPGSVEQSPAGALGFDTDTELSASNAQAFVQSGFKFVIRYLSLSEPEEEGDLSTAEAADILNSGLALMAVQHAPDPGWTPTESLGSEYGAAAVANAQAVGLPGGMNIWLDLEGIADVASSFDVIAYCNAWFAEMSAAGYVPGLYVGADAILDGEELYYALSVEHYWQSGSEVPDVEVRGYCMVQTIDDAYEIDGCAYDQDIAQADKLGNTPMWLINPLAQPVV
jgi:hypothetical protein